jgi:hypothetical protein
MNLKFLEDVYQTIKVMRNGFYYLGLLVGIHTVTFTVYLAYKYLNDSNDSKNQNDSKKQNSEEEELIQNPVVEMQDIGDSQICPFDKVSDDTNDKRHKSWKNIAKSVEYKFFLEQKRDELGDLVLQLDTVYDNIGQIRECLENLNNKTD